MAESGERSNPQNPLLVRAVERYGGREATGSVLWLEHAQSITYADEAGNQQTITLEDLVTDHEEAAAENYRSTDINGLYREDAALVTREAWLRQAILPALPVRISGDELQPRLKLNADLKVFVVPRELARYTGVIAELGQEIAIGEDGEIQDAQDVHNLSETDSLTFSLRFVPTQGRVKSAAVYPGYTDSDMGITAAEFGTEVIRIGIGYQKYFELYREPQEGELPPLIAPHQF